MTRPDPAGQAGPGGEIEGTNSENSLHRKSRRRRYSYAAAVELARVICEETGDMSLRHRMIGSTIGHLVCRVGCDDLDDTAGQIATEAKMSNSGSARTAVKAVWDRLEEVGLVETLARPPVGGERGTPKVHRFLFPRRCDVWWGRPEGEVFYSHQSARVTGDYGKESHPSQDRKPPARGTESARLTGDTHSSSIDTHSGFPGDVPESVYETGLVGGGRFQIAETA